MKNQSSFSFSFSTIFHRLFCYFLLSLITFNGLFHFFYGLVIWPVKLISPDHFRKLSSFLLFLSVPGFLCIPFSWINNKLYCNGLGRIKCYKDRNLVILANHSARVDWVLGLFIGACYGQRVTFVTEAFILILPFLGWFRYIIEDMFVFRSFKRDKDRLEKNIMEFHKSGVTRWVFLSPEGHIADFNPTDQKYIAECEEFVRERGLEPFEMVLTPRYKGMQCFNKVMTDSPENIADNSRVAKVLSVAMTYVQNGEVLVKPLRSRERVVPDLWSIVNGNLECYVHFHTLELSSDPVLLRDQLLKDSAMKDKLLKHFYLHKRYPNAHPTIPDSSTPDTWKPMFDDNFPRDLGPDTTFQRLPPSHLFMNISFFVQTLGPLYVAYKTGNLFGFSMFFLTLYVLLAVSHIMGEVLAAGQSRESLPFEGIMKALMFRYKGIEGKHAEEDLSGSKIQMLEHEGDDVLKRSSLKVKREEEPELSYPKEFDKRK